MSKSLATYSFGVLSAHCLYSITQFTKGHFVGYLAEQTVSMTPDLNKWNNYSPGRHNRGQCGSRNQITNLLFDKAAFHQKGW